MMALLDTRLLKHGAQRHQIPTAAERDAVRLKHGSGPLSRCTVTVWTKLTDLYAHRCDPKLGAQALD